MNQNCVQNMDTFWYISTEGDSNEAKIRVAEYTTILFQQGQFLGRVRPTKFKANTDRRRLT